MSIIILWGVNFLNKEKIEYFACLTVASFGVVAGVYIFAKYIFLAVLPFLIGWTVAFSVRPLAQKIAKITKLSLKVVSAIIGAVSIICILTLLIGTLIYALGEAWNFISDLKENNKILEILKKMLNPIENIFGELEGGEELKSQISGAISNAVSSSLGKIVVFLTGFVSSVPRVILFVIVTSIATIYFCLDLEIVNKTVKKLLPAKIQKNLSEMKNITINTLLKYLRSYAILMLITFLTMVFGFLIMRIPFAILLGFLVALLDALPLIGVGTILIPWGIFEIIFGSLPRGIGLLVLFLISWVARQFLEPRIVGKNVGIHPILSLVLIYLGCTFFGVMGLILVPVSAIIVKIIYEERLKEI